MGYMEDGHRSDVEKVLDGDVNYDDLTSEEEQAIVRATRTKLIRADIAALDFEEEFNAEGRAWTDIDADGNPVRRTPVGAST